MEQDHDYSPPPPTVWSQPPLTTTRRRKPRIDPVVLIILIPILALVFLFFFLPPFLYHASHILKPGSVKSTWDSLNIFLVLFAIICGVTARKNDDTSSSTTDQGNGFVATTTSSNSINLLDSSGQWVGFSDRKVGLRRNSSSYPDLRQESVWENYDYPNRYFDDFHLNSPPVSRYYNTLSRRIQKEKEIMHMDPMTPVPGDVHRRSRRSEADPVEFSDIKEIGVDTFEVISNVPPATPPPPPPPPPPRPPNSKRHSFRSVGREIESDELKKVRSPPPPPPPPPPPVTEVRVHRSRHRHNKLERKVSDATKEIATAISSLYNNQRKRKNKRKLRNVPEISGSSDTSPTSSVHSIQSPGNEQPLQTLTPPPPPPLPPPPSTMFQNLFKKGGKHKRIHSMPVTISQRAPPPPPPPPPNSIFNNIFKSGNKSKRFLSPRTMDTPPPLPPSSSSLMNNIFKTGTKSKRFNSITGKSTPPPPPPGYTIKNEPRSSSKGKPPLPAPKTSGYYERDEFIASGSESPLIPMAPPPPPPFRMPAMKFELRGDFVKVQSSQSSVCSSPDRGDLEISSMIIDGGDSVDVNAMADSFISRLKDEWRMEKINYVKDKLG